MFRLNFIILFFLLINFTAFSQNTVTIRNNNLTVKISTRGAELQSIKDKSGVEYLWQGDSAFWGGRAPVMFPVNVRFKDEKFTYKGVEYEMPRMGLAKISDFEVIEKDPGKVVLQLESNEKTLKHYPFPFRLEIIYRLEGNRLINQFIVENTGIETMYFVLGGHPGFRFPYAEEREKNQYVFSKKFNLSRTEISNSLVQPNQILLLKNEDSLPLGDYRIPNGGMFVKNMPSRKIGVGIIGGRTFIEVDLGDFPNVNLWSPPGMPFACIEPMVGHHDLADSPLAIEAKDYLVMLEAGGSSTYQFSIIVHGPRK
ncbi:MAG: aldose 1-epimerase family protein [Bacteroidota bacterium]